MEIIKELLTVDIILVPLDHNQFVTINRNSAVELNITMETFGGNHKDAIITALKNNRYKLSILKTKAVYQ